MRKWCCIVVLTLVLCLAVSLVGCGETQRELNEPIPVPQDMDLSSPEQAVRTYLSWLTYSYRNMDSEIATPTMTPDLAQRVGYYITMNAATEKALNQRLDSFEIIDIEVADTVARVTTEEGWTFNYMSLQTGQFDEPVIARYRVVYTVLFIEAEWRVQAADATVLETTAVETTAEQVEDEQIEDDSSK